MMWIRLAVGHTPRTLARHVRRYQMLPGSTVLQMLDGNSVVYRNTSDATASTASAREIHVASFPANAPIEDAFSVNRIDFGAKTCGSSGAAPAGKVFNLFAVYDGHWAPHCSNALSQILPVFIQDTISDPNPSFYAPSSNAVSPPSTTGSELPQKLSSAFIHCDASLLSYPFSLLPESFFETPNDKILDLVDKEVREQVGQALLPAVTGSCALAALVRGNELVVANTGDCRAVLGSEGVAGTFVAKDLSKDHNGENASEVARLRSEHPEEEKKDVIFAHPGDRSKTMRVLGGLMPTRSFGDAKYKYPLDVIEKVDILEPSIKRVIPMQPLCKTPPYITAAPEVSEHTLTSKDRFLILATDGLFDQLSSKQAVEVVSSLLGNKLPKQFPPWLPTSEKLATHLLPTTVKTCVDGDGNVVNDFEGVNLATSLVRAAMVGGSGRVSSKRDAAGLMNLAEEAELRAGLEPGQARNVRDDITCIVVVF
ncbi:phosphatase 2C-like domain-containing protein [Obelidium mucronatum]|nr:phosphatase 2C-like domain-containing protein [Obelidium mucronatum]